MSTQRYRKSKYKKMFTKKKREGKSKIKTALSAAEDNFKKVGSISKAKKILKQQALLNARKLFGSI